MLKKQALYSLSHLPSHHNEFFGVCACIQRLEEDNVSSIALLTYFHETESLIGPELCFLVSLANQGAPVIVQRLQVCVAMPSFLGGCQRLKLDSYTCAPSALTHEPSSQLP